MRCKEAISVQRQVDGGHVAARFYPDTGCIRFSDATGTAHELRPPHSWLEMRRVSRISRMTTSNWETELEILLARFCMTNAHYLRTRRQTIERLNGRIDIKLI